MKHIDELLRRVASGAIPALPDNFEQSVWRRVRWKKAEEATPGWLDLMVTAIFQPKLALPVFAFSLLIGASLSVLDATRPDAAESLGLQVFSFHAPALPSTLISGNL